MKGLPGASREYQCSPTVRVIAPGLQLMHGRRTLKAGVSAQIVNNEERRVLITALYPPLRSTSLIVFMGAPIVGPAVFFTMHISG